MENENRQLYSISAEEAFIGAAIISPGSLQEIDLDPEDIYVQRYRWVYAAMRSLMSRGTTPDFVTLSDELERQGKLEECGGPARLAGFVNLTPSSLGIDQYADIIRNYARRRRILQSANDLAQAAFSKDDIDGPVARVVDSLTTGIRPKSGAVHWSRSLSRLYDDVVERSNNPTDVWGIPTGFKDYDAATGGLQLGEVLYIGGEPGIGKSIWSMQMGLNLGAAGIPGAIYSLEMRELQIVRRAVSSLAKIETRKLKTGRLEEADWPVFTCTIEQGAEYPIYICDQPDLTTSALRADLARLKLRYDIQWFVLDYLFLMGDGEGKMDDNQRTALLSRRIKNIASELGLAGITVNSVTKDGMGDGSRPTQKNIRGSGQVIHDADVICFITKHIPDKAKWENEDENLRTITFGKGRELENPKPFHLVKLPSYPAFGDYYPERPQPIPNAQRVTPMNGNGKSLH